MNAEAEPAEQLEVAFKSASVSIITSKRKKGDTESIRLIPCCEIRHKDIHYLSRIKALLLNLSVSCTIRKKFLRIQGVQNCSIITQFISGQDWWLQAMQMFEEGKHKTHLGIIEIAKLRDEHASKRKILTRRDVGDVARILAEQPETA